MLRVILNIEKNHGSKTAELLNTPDENLLSQHFISLYVLSSNSTDVGCAFRPFGVGKISRSQSNLGFDEIV